MVVAANDDGTVRTYDLAQVAPAACSGGDAAGDAAATAPLAAAAAVGSSRAASGSLVQQHAAEPISLAVDGTKVVVGGVRGELSVHCLRTGARWCSVDSATGSLGGAVQYVAFEGALMAAVTPGSVRAFDFAHRLIGSSDGDSEYAPATTVGGGGGGHCHRRGPSALLGGCAGLIGRS